MQGAVHELMSVAVAGVVGSTRLPSLSFHFRTWSTDLDPVLSTKATMVPSRDNTGELVTLPPVAVVTLYAHLTVGVEPHSPAGEPEYRFSRATRLAWPLSRPPEVEVWVQLKRELGLVDDDTTMPFPAVPWTIAVIVIPPAIF